MTSYFKKGINLLRDISVYFYKGWQVCCLKSYVKFFFQQLIEHLNRFRHSLEHYNMGDEKLQKLQQASRGLYSLLPADSRFSYSILIVIAEPRPLFFRKTLESIVNQRIPSLEILFGLTCPLSQEMEQIIADYSSQVRVLRSFEGEKREELINRLAKEASGCFLLIMGEEDWLRPDFIFRYEQTLRLFPDCERRVLYCDLNTLNEYDGFLEFNHHRQPAQICFPFFFKQLITKGFLIPAALWNRAGGLRSEYLGAEQEDLLLRLDLAGAIFQHLPFCLYFLRAGAKQVEREKSQKMFLKVLDNYTRAKDLDWKWSSGYLKETARAIPAVKQEHTIQVIIPYKDQKNLTMKCVEHLLNQKDVHLKITAVDNRSEDPSIAEEIKLLGGEVIFVDEPFNFSRLNNLAVSCTQTAAHCDVLLFLNNDVELEPDALSEMLRWIDQPLIGMVGCRLHYPDGRLQHGGVQLLDRQEKQEMRWEHIEKLLPFEGMNLTKTLGIFDAVTAACAMMKRHLFLEVGGFDEVWYPIGYSDTNLAFKVGVKGLKCFYTPYAKGIHYESVSRKTSIEDYENSWWLHRQLIASKNLYRF